MALFKTARLIVREFNLEDAPFVFKLVNEPSWIENIGDKNIHNIDDAKNYLLNGPMKSYRENGFGLYLIELKTTGMPIGMCGLVKREGLDCPDVGYALMPEFWGLGLASEAAKATLDFAKEALSIERVLGVTSVENVGSIRVLEKIGLRFDQIIQLPGSEQLSRLFIPIDEVGSSDGLINAESEPLSESVT
ncbi:GNAT family N-acetyltransferase [Aliikangiella maris]|uniref:GNAT family N-acetyltransferase n=2 Tax=Aliikangiella maris TaxID=3162458 RepID=A0ABV2BSB7_9GAMM